MFKLISAKCMKLYIVLHYIIIYEKYLQQYKIKITYIIISFVIIHRSACWIRKHLNRSHRNWSLLLNGREEKHFLSCYTSLFLLSILHWFFLLKLNSPPTCFDPFMAMFWFRRLLHHNYIGWSERDISLVITLWQG